MKILIRFVYATLKDARLIHGLINDTMGTFSIAQLLHCPHFGEYAIYDHDGNGISYFHLIN